jgi:hypothetical protein
MNKARIVYSLAFAIISAGVIYCGYLNSRRTIKKETKAAHAKVHFTRALAQESMNKRWLSCQTSCQRICLKVPNK